MVHGIGDHTAMERHLSGRAAWLRAAVLGANDGLISTASLMVGVAAVVTAGFVTTIAQGAEQSLSGTITSASGEKLGGVTVSAKRDGTTITTSVYTDEQGNYYFPPLEAGNQ